MTLDEILNSLLGHQLSGVGFVMDYLQLHFDSDNIICYIWPIITTKTEKKTFGEKEYRNELCSIIQKKIEKIDYKSGGHLKIFFEDGIELFLDFNELSELLPEGAIVNLHTKHTAVLD